LIIKNTKKTDKIKSFIFFTAFFQVQIKTGEQVIQLHVIYMNFDKEDTQIFRHLFGESLVNSRDLLLVIRDGSWKETGAWRVFF
jgi:hypothetical protein